MHQFCLYYQAYVVPQQCWFLTAVLRSFEHVSFDRTLDISASTFEFFVTPGMKDIFLEIMADLARQQVIHNLQELPNRLLDPKQTV